MSENKRKWKLCTQTWQSKNAKSIPNGIEYTETKNEKTFGNIMLILNKEPNSFFFWRLPHLIMNCRKEREKKTKADDKIVNELFGASK